MGSVLMGIGNIVIVKPSPSSSYYVRVMAAANGSYINLCEGRVQERESIVEESIG